VCSVRISANFKRIALEIFFIILGFSLAVVWDMIRDFRTEQQEIRSITIMLKSELSQTHATIQSNIKTIDANQKILSEGKEVIAPLLLLPSDAWNSAKLRNSLFLKETSDLFCFMNLYTGISIVNSKIINRENYRTANQAMNNYHDRLSKIDLDIKEALEKLSPLLQTAQNTIYRLYVWKVEGGSFQVSEKGVVQRQ